MDNGLYVNALSQYRHLKTKFCKHSAKPSGTEWLAHIINITKETVLYKPDLSISFGKYFARFRSHVYKKKNVKLLCLGVENHVCVCFIFRVEST